MGVYVKDLKMPKNCGSCPFFEVVSCEEDSKDYRCARTGLYIFPKEKSIYCPLVEMKPHGLIDKQMLLRNISENQFTNSYVGHEDEYAFWDKVWDYIINAPTIIESEEEDA